MSGPVIAVFAMGERGHFMRLLPIIQELSRAGAVPYVFTVPAFRAAVARAGGRFVDLFAGHSLDEADATSIPVPSRFVTFAGRFGAAVANEARSLRPSIVVHDTFAVIGVVVARRLGLPRVNVCACHNLAPRPTLAALAEDPRVRLSDACLAAVEQLRTEHGLRDASPFSYVSGVSRDLNLYCEPPSFLRPEERAPFEPLAFIGSLWPDGRRRDPRTATLFSGRPGVSTRVYASFGTVVWRYYRDEAMSALVALRTAIANRPDVDAVVSLGAAGPSGAADRLRAPNVRVEAYVDQWQVLSDASVFFTHQGLNSTHEAIYHRVPMVSYAFFSDQPSLAARCRELGLSVPLVEGVRGRVTPDDVHDALDRVDASRASMNAALDRARAWEDETIRARPAAIRRVLELAR
jgi:MGT family glycosyltransferase